MRFLAAPNVASDRVRAMKGRMSTAYLNIYITFYPADVSRLASSLGNRHHWTRSDKSAVQTTGRLTPDELLYCG